MNKAKINYLVDALMFLAVITSALTGILIYFLFPAGKGSGWSSFIGIAKHSWRDIHTWSGLAFVGLAAFHPIHHWRWIVCMTKELISKEKKKYF